jgi:hypothetical protein
MVFRGQPKTTWSFKHGLGKHDLCLSFQLWVVVHISCLKPHMKENQTCERFQLTWPWRLTIEVFTTLGWKEYFIIPCELSSRELARVFLTTYKHCSMANTLHRIHASQTKHSKFSLYNTARLTICQLIICQSAKKLWFGM